MQGSSSLIKDVGPTVVGFITVGVTLLISFLITRDFNRRTLMQKQQEDERKEISKKLNSFYGPLQRLRGKSMMLTEIFKRGREFRTLVELLNNGEFKGNDAELLDEIIEIGKKSDELILNSSGLVDNKDLKEILDVASTHYTLIRLAKEGKLKGEVERFKDHVFPTDLDNRLEKEVDRLNNKLDLLNREIAHSWFSEMWAKLRSKHRHIMDNEKEPILEKEDYELGRMWAELKAARLSIESIELRLRELSEQSSKTA
jgi:hypothetical protein